MQIKIDIPEDVYTRLFDNGTQDNEIAVDDVCEMARVIRLGTPLPEGHGRLIDADELKKEYPHDTDWDYPVNTNSYVVESIDNSPTIIEAESEVEG